MRDLAPYFWAIPWVLLPAAVIFRFRRSQWVTDFPAAPPNPAPRVAVIVPARNERRNIERCLRSVLASSYPALEVVLVDDHSTDGTGEIGRAIARDDARLRVIEAPPLPAGWFGKQWACWTGARATTGEILLFVDADTHQAPDLIGRCVHAMRDMRAGLLSVAGRQEMHSFWERLVQPVMFYMLAARYGGTNAMNGARRAADVIASGQCLFMTRDAYDAIGGHEAVREMVAEDLALAQLAFRTGGRPRILYAEHEFSTHMYASLPELIRGWRKNVFAGGRHSMPLGALGQLVFPLALLSFPVAVVAPWVALPLAVAGVLPPAWLTWSAISVAASTAWAAFLFRAIGVPLRYAPIHALGGAMVLYIFTGAVLRGSSVEWKGRQYVSR